MVWLKDDPYVSCYSVFTEPEVSDHIRQAYIAGKYSSPNPDDILTNVRIAIQAAGDVANNGFFPIIPHTAIGHRGVSWGAAMEKCMNLISALSPEHDILVLLPGWEFSRGARVERVMAKIKGIEIFTLAEITGGTDE